MRKACCAVVGALFVAAPAMAEVLSASAAEEQDSGTITVTGVQDQKGYVPAETNAAKIAAPDRVG